MSLPTNHDHLITSSLIENAKELCKVIQTMNSAEVRHLVQDEHVNPFTRVDYDEFFTPWYWVYCCKNYDIIDILLKNGADPNYRIEEQDGETVIFGAILNGREDIIELLVKYKADPNITNANGLTPLYLAVDMHDSFNLVKKLIELGADISVCNANNQDLVSYLREKNPENIETFYEATLTAFESLQENQDTELLRDNLIRFYELSKNHAMSLEVSNKIADLAQIITIPEKQLLLSMIKPKIHLGDKMAFHHAMIGSI
jgi:hypothetical protein